MENVVHNRFQLMPADEVFREYEFIELLDQLCYPYGLILYLHDCEDMDFGAIADEILEIPEFKVRILYHAALDRLGELLISLSTHP